VLLLYLAGTTIFGVMFGDRSALAKDYFLANKTHNNLVSIARTRCCCASRERRHLACISSSSPAFRIAVRHH